MAADTDPAVGGGRRLRLQSGPREWRRSGRPRRAPSGNSMASSSSCRPASKTNKIIFHQIDETPSLEAVKSAASSGPDVTPFREQVAFRTAAAVSNDDAFMFSLQLNYHNPVQQSAAYCIAGNVGRQDDDDIRSVEIPATKRKSDRAGRNDCPASTVIESWPLHCYCCYQRPFCEIQSAHLKSGKPPPKWPPSRIGHIIRAQEASTHNRWQVKLITPVHIGPAVNWPTIISDDGLALEEKEEEEECKLANKGKGGGVSLLMHSVGQHFFLFAGLGRRGPINQCGWRPWKSVPLGWLLSRDNLGAQIGSPAATKTRDLLLAGGQVYDYICIDCNRPALSQCCNCQPLADNNNSGRQPEETNSDRRIEIQRGAQMCQLMALSTQLDDNWGFITGLLFLLFCFLLDLSLHSSYLLVCCCRLANLYRNGHSLNNVPADKRHSFAAGAHYRDYSSGLERQCCHYYHYYYCYHYHHHFACYYQADHHRHAPCRPSVLPAALSSSSSKVRQARGGGACKRPVRVAGGCGGEWPAAGKLITRQGTAPLRALEPPRPPKKNGRLRATKCRASEEATITKRRPFWRHLLLLALLCLLGGRLAERESGARWLAAAHSQPSIIAASTRVFGESAAFKRRRIVDDDNNDNNNNNNNNMTVDCKPITWNSMGQGRKSEANSDNNDGRATWMQRNDMQHDKAPLGPSSWPSNGSPMIGRPDADKIDLIWRLGAGRHGRRYHSRASRVLSAAKGNRKKPIESQHEPIEREGLRVKTRNDTWSLKLALSSTSLLRPRRRRGLLVASIVKSSHSDHVNQSGEIRANSGRVLARPAPRGVRAPHRSARSPSTHLGLLQLNSHQLVPINQNPNHNSQNCPPVCACTWKNGKQFADCSNHHNDLVQLPKGLDPLLQVLNLSTNYLAHLPESAFVSLNLSNLQRIYMSNCQMESIHLKAFDRLRLIVELDFSWNKLTFVPLAQMSHLTLMRKLTMRGNPLRRLDGSTLSVHGALWATYDNQTSGEPNDSNNNNNKLTANLSRLVETYPELARSLVQDADDNSVIRPATHLARSGEKQAVEQDLETLRLLVELADSAQTTELDLDAELDNGGQLSEPPDIAKVQSVAEPELGGGQHKRQLLQLGLLFVHLQELDFGQCQLSYINWAALRDLNQLKRLILDGNQLSQLSGRLVAALPQNLHQLALEDNPWRCDCRLAALKRWLLTTRTPLSAPVRCQLLEASSPSDQEATRKEAASRNKQLARRRLQHTELAGELYLDQLGLDEFVCSPKAVGSSANTSPKNASSEDKELQFTKTANLSAVYHYLAATLIRPSGLGEPATLETGGQLARESIQASEDDRVTMSCSALAYPESSVDVIWLVDYNHQEASSQPATQLTKSQEPAGRLPVEERFVVLYDSKLHRATPGRANNHSGRPINELSLYGSRILVRESMGPAAGESLAKESQLVIQSAHVDDSARYKCIVVNKAGSASLEYLLRVARSNWTQTRVQSSRDQRANDPPAAAAPASEGAGRARLLLAQKQQEQQQQQQPQPSTFWLRSSYTFQITIVVVSVLMGAVLLAFLLFCIIIYQIKPSASTNVTCSLLPSDQPTVNGSMYLTNTPLFPALARNQSALQLAAKPDGSASFYGAPVAAVVSPLANRQRTSTGSQQGSSPLGASSVDTASLYSAGHAQTNAMAVHCDPFTGQTPVHQLVATGPPMPSFQQMLQQPIYPLNRPPPANAINLSHQPLSPIQESALAWTNLQQHPMDRLSPARMPF